MKLLTIPILEVYKNHIQKYNLEHDKAQIEIIIILEEIKKSLELKFSKKLPQNNKWFFSHRNFINFFSNIFMRNKYHGLYLYSSVGRGKTMLMDLFFNNIEIPNESKYRVHFHLFMRSIHNKLQLLSGSKNPIRSIIADDYSKYKLICLDEFMVHDIADAMILSKVLQYLLDNNIILITTSNVKPDDLYKKGLQRRSFLPAINMINTKLKVACLGGDLDYRANILSKTNCFFSPNNSDNRKKLDEIFIKISNQPTKLPEHENLTEITDINVADRLINVVKVFDYTVWFDFNVICNSPRANADYLEIAEVYKVVLISNLFQLDDSTTDITRRFINLIDILYDYNVKLIICSDVEIDKIYVGKILNFEFLRTISRLKEMQSNKYISKVHL